MPIPEKVVEEVVKEVSVKMADPNYTNVLVGSWVQEQPAVTQYIKAHADELGSAEGIINTIFHAGLMATCFQRHDGRSLPSMSFGDLDHVAEWEREEQFKKRQPALMDYLAANVEAAPMKNVLMLIGLAMDYVS